MAAATRSSAGSSGLRAFAIAATLLLHGFGAWLLLGPQHANHRPRVENPQRQLAQRPGAGSKAAPLKGPLAGSAASERGARSGAGEERPRRDPEDIEWRSAYQAGLAYEQKRQDAIRRIAHRMFGDDLARLMELPVAQAWPRLEALALEGDRIAGEALVMLDCLSTGERASAPELLEQMVSGFDRRDAAFVTGALAGEDRSARERQEECRAAGAGIARLRQLVEARSGPLPDVSSDPWPLAERIQVVDAFQRLYGSVGESGIPSWPLSDPIAAIVARLNDPAQTARPGDIETLIAAIDSDPLALEAFTDCLRKGCADIAAESPAERLGWDLRAARNGSAAGIAEVVEQMQANGDPVSAYAWASFGRSLALDGCLPLPEAGAVADAMRITTHIAKRLTPAQLTLGEQRARELAARYGTQARAAQGCE